MCRDWLQQALHQPSHQDTVGYEFDNQNFTVKVQGQLETFMAGKQLSESYKEYLISFINRGGVLMLKSFEEIKEKENESN